MSALSNQIEAGRAYIAIRLDKAALINGLADVGKRMRAFGASVQSFGSDMMRLSLVGAVPVAAAVNSFIKFDDQMRITGAIANTTQKQLESLTAQARYLGSRTAFTAQQVASGMTALARLGNTADKISKSIEHIMYLTRATGNEMFRLNEIAELTGNIMNQYGIDINQVSRVTDILTYGSNRAAQTVQDIGQAMRSVGGIANELGDSMEDTVTSMILLSNRGIKGELLGTALRKAYDGILSNEEAIQQFGVATRNAFGELRKPYMIIADLFTSLRTKTKAEQVKIAKEIFGLRGMLAGMSIGVNAKEISEIRMQLNRIHGLAKNTAEQMESGIGGAFRRLVSMAQEVGLSIGEAVQTPLSALMRSVTSMLDIIGQFVRENKALIQSFLVISAVGASAGASIMAIGLGIKVIAAPLNILSTSLLFLKKSFIITFGIPKLMIKGVMASFKGLAVVFKALSTSTVVFKALIKGVHAGVFLLNNTLQTCIQISRLTAITFAAMSQQWVVLAGLAVAFGAAIYGVTKAYPQVKAAAGSALGKMKGWWDENKAAVIDFGKTLYSSIQAGDLEGAFKLAMAGVMNVFYKFSSELIKVFADVRLSVLEIWNEITDKLAGYILQMGRDFKYLWELVKHPFGGGDYEKNVVEITGKYNSDMANLTNDANFAQQERISRHQSAYALADEWKTRGQKNLAEATENAKLYAPLQKTVKELNEALDNSAAAYRKSVEQGGALSFMKSSYNAYTSLAGAGGNRTLQKNRIRTLISDFEAVAENIADGFEKRLKYFSKDRRITADERRELEKLLQEHGQALYMTEELRARYQSINDSVGAVMQKNDEAQQKERNSAIRTGSSNPYVFKYGLSYVSPAERAARALDDIKTNVKFMKERWVNVGAVVPQ